jgi:NhaA family Na+:H+ antiporter
MSHENDTFHFASGCKRLAEEAFMSEPRQAGADLPQLPRELLDWLTKPLARFLRIEAAGGATLLLFTLAAVGISNSPWTQEFSIIWETPVGVRFGSLEFTRSLRGWINDGLMTLFFFVVALELKRELILGELNSPRAFALPISAALGGMLVPAALYSFLQWGQPGARGWGAVMATDTAFVVGCLALLGSRIPQSLKVFMLSLAIVDDIGAILVVAIGYSSRLDWAALALGVLGFAIVYGLARLGVRSVAIYVLAGCAIWLAVDASGVHATVTGVVLGLMTPTRGWVSDKLLHDILDRVVAYPSGDQRSRDMHGRNVLQLAGVAVRETLSPVERLELALHPWVSFVIMPIFALANAGLQISPTGVEGPVTTAVFLGFVLGKPIGVVIFSWLAVRAGVAMRPPDLGWGMVTAGGLLAGVGFTMALLIANLGFSESMLNAAKQGIFLASILSSTGGMALLFWLSPVR